MKKLKKRNKILIVILSVLLIATTGFFAWACMYYGADEMAKKYYYDDKNVIKEKDLVIINPETSNNDLIIFYPGAKVEYIAYVPILKKLSTYGYTCVIPKMPLNMAIFDVDRADKIYDRLSGFSNYFMAGHSMGGSTASSYAAKHSDKVDGLVLMGAYNYGNYAADKTLTIYGSYNSNLEEHIDPTGNVLKIEGGNHAYFGNYGKQIGDPDGDITREEQQNIAANATYEFLNKLKQS